MCGFVAPHKRRVSVTQLQIEALVLGQYQLILRDQQNQYKMKTSESKHLAVPLAATVFDKLISYSILRDCRLSGH